MRTPHVEGMECINCSNIHKDVQEFQGCPDCRTKHTASNLFPVYDYSDLTLSREYFEVCSGGPFAFPETLPVSQGLEDPNGVGNTPLIKAPSYAKDWNVGEVWIKDESQNPTWSYKDRLCGVAVAKALEENREVIAVSSTGNHGASTAAYAARANLDCVVFTVTSIPETMHAFLGAYDPNIVAAKDLETRWTLMENCIDEFDWYPTSNFVKPPVGSNPFGIEGYKSIAYEICRDLEWEVPDWIVQPTAYGDGLVGIWRGFVELKEFDLIDKLPKLLAVERFGSLQQAFETGQRHVAPVETEQTSAFSIGVHISTQQALVTLQDSNGSAAVVSEEDLVDAQRDMSKNLGLYPESAAATGIAAMKDQSNTDKIDSNDTIVIINTSAGLKDTTPLLDRLDDIRVVEGDKAVKQIVKDVI